MKNYVFSFSNIKIHFVSNEPVREFSEFVLYTGDEWRKVQVGVIASLREKDAEDHREESFSITLARWLKNSENIKRIVKLWRVQDRNKMALWVG